VLSFESRGPSIQRASGSFIAAPDGFDAATDLADHEDAEPKGSSVDGLEPCPNICVGTFLFADLGDDVRVEKPSAHRSTFRRLVRGRSKSSSAPTSGIATRVALSERGPSRRSERTRISRCSASAERLCAAACRLSETTTSSGRFRTMSCAIDINDSTAGRGATRRAGVSFGLLLRRALRGFPQLPVLVAHGRVELLGELFRKSRHTHELEHVGEIAQPVGSA
jgi:hypothetical protein